MVTVRATTAGTVEALAIPDGSGLETGTEVLRLVRPEDDDLEVVSEGAYELKLGLAASGSPGSSAGHFHADGTFHEGKDE